MARVICMDGTVIDNYDRNEAAMQPSKEWSVLIITNPNLTSVTPSKQGFAARFRILDPFQRYHAERLEHTARNIAAC
jgi:hypothetical protein